MKLLAIVTSKTILTLAIAVIAVVAVSCQTAQKNQDRNLAFSQARSRPVQDHTIHILATTDLHGYLEVAAKEPFPAVKVDTMKGYFNIARQVDRDTMFLDSGDLFQGTIVSDDKYGSPVITWMNEEHYVATAIGNHDFDFGPGEGHDVVTQSGQDPLGALKARITQARFPFLSANLCSIEEDSNQCSNASNFAVASIAKPYVIHSVHGLKIGIIGLTTVSTPETTTASNVAQLRFMPLVDTLERFVPEVKAAGADAIIVVAHEGGFCDKGKCSPSDPIFKMIDDLKPETRAQLPLVLAGHTHNYVNTVYNGVHVMINGKYGQSFGYLTLQYDASTSQLQVKEANSIDFCSQVYPDTGYCDKGTGTPVSPTFLGRTVVADSNAFRGIKRQLKNADAQSAVIVGKLVTPLKSGTPESSTGELMADAFRYCGGVNCANPADIAFQNNGGVRVSGIPAGPVNYGEVFELDPFDDYYSLLSLTGKQVHDLLAAWWAYGSGLPQVSGLVVTFSKTKSVPRAISDGNGKVTMASDPTISITTSDGKPLDEQKTYNVVMTDFLATGGSGADAVVRGLKPQINYDRILRDAMGDYFKANAGGLDYSKLGGRLIEQP